MTGDLLIDLGLGVIIGCILILAFEVIRIIIEDLSD